MNRDAAARRDVNNVPSIDRGYLLVSRPLRRVTRQDLPPGDRELSHPEGTETRPPLMPLYFTFRPGVDTVERFSGKHVVVTRRKQPAGHPGGVMETPGFYPQRPTFRAPTEPWSDPYTIEV